MCSLPPACSVRSIFFCSCSVFLNSGISLFLIFLVLSIYFVYVSRSLYDDTKTKNGVVNNFQTITEADELGQETYVRLVTLLLDG